MCLNVKMTWIVRLFVSFFFSLLFVQLFNWRLFRPAIQLMFCLILIRNKSEIFLNSMGIFLVNSEQHLWHRNSFRRDLSGTIIESFPLYGMNRWFSGRLSVFDVYRAHDDHGIVFQCQQTPIVSLRFDNEMVSKRLCRFAFGVILFICRWLRFVSDILLTFFSHCTLPSPLFISFRCEQIWYIDFDYCDDSLIIMIWFRFLLH